LGHTYVKATFFNAVDYVQHLEGKLKLSEVKKVEVEALVDTGATFPALPKEIITELELPSLGEHPAETAEGAGKVELAANAIIKIEDRIAQSPIITRPKGATPLIGVVALEQMGYKVDPTTGKLIKGLPCCKLTPRLPHRPNLTILITGFPLSRSPSVYSFSVANR